MAKIGILFALLFAGGYALPTTQDGPGFHEDMSIFFDHTVKDVQGRIVGGTVAAEGAYPWMVAMLYGVLGSFLCGGSVITKSHVLTAAHCTQFSSTGGVLSPTVRVRIGSNRWESGGQTYMLRGFRNHPRWSIMTIKNDIGVLFTSTDIIFSDRVAPVPLNTNFIPGDVPVRVSGWGRMWTDGPISAQLLELNTMTFDGQRCIREMAIRSVELNIRAPAVDPALEICGFVAVDHGVCSGDSGSAMVLSSNNEQVGIVSWGLPCAVGAPDIYVRVSAFIDWIAESIAEPIA